MNHFWNWVNPENGEETRTLELYGPIAEETWLNDEVTPEEFRKELNEGEGDVVILMNSPGGDCFAASRIYFMLNEYKQFKNSSITVKIEGMAASAASVVAMAGDSVQMAAPAMMVIHNPATGAWGDRNVMLKTADILDEVKESIINAYELKTGLPRDKVWEMMESETWLSARTAIELGFADVMLGNSANKAFMFSNSVVERNITNKIAAKVQTENTGAKVSDLRNALYERLLKF